MTSTSRFFTLSTLILHQHPNLEFQEFSTLVKPLQDGNSIQLRYPAPPSIDLYSTTQHRQLIKISLVSESNSPMPLSGPVPLSISGLVQTTIALSLYTLRTFGI
ncbi:hypothetical protein EPI10_016956 [Gossypium australe]|uniref:Uncharacterized protein n=1 Tax=Gossypium australe TaxID=47621 RepID=A0A5B6VQH9_9ROSI|nr:hypothetical protein EPI10_016956 [Gossypium australe]